MKHLKSLDNVIFKSCLFQTSQNEIAIIVPKSARPLGEIRISLLELIFFKDLT